MRIVSFPEPPTAADWFRGEVVESVVSDIDEVIAAPAVNRYSANRADFYIKSDLVVSRAAKYPKGRRRRDNVMSSAVGYADPQDVLPVCLKSYGLSIAEVDYIILAIRLQAILTSASPEIICASATN